MLVGLEALTDMKLVAERKITHSLIFPLILHFFSFSSIFFIFAFFFYMSLRPTGVKSAKQGHRRTKIVSIIIPSAAKVLYLFWCMLVEAVVLL